MIFFGLVDEMIGQVIDFYATREEAQAELRDALSDEPEWAASLHVQAFDFETSAN